MSFKNGKAETINLWGGGGVEHEFSLKMNKTPALGSV